MNLAISTVVLFILLLPGLIFRRFYFTQEFSKEYIKLNFYELFLSSFVPSLLFHTIAYYVVMLFGYEISLEMLAKIITVNEESRNNFDGLDLYTSAIIGYNVSLSLIAGLLGLLSRKIVRLNRLDIKKKIFRFQNSWHYLFSGEYLGFPKAAIELTHDTVGAIELVYVDTMIETSEGTVIYEGILVDYGLSKTGGLDYFLLKMVKRRFLRDDPNCRPESDAHYSVPGHSMVIQYDKVLNMNLTFYKLEESKENGEVYYRPKQVG